MTKETLIAYIPQIIDLLAKTVGTVLAQQHVGTRTDAVGTLGRLDRPVASRTDPSHRLGAATEAGWI